MFLVFAADAREAAILPVGLRRPLGPLVSGCRATGVTDLSLLTKVHPQVSPDLAVALTDPDSNACFLTKRPLFYFQKKATYIGFLRYNGPLLFYLVFP